jgi:hypothetical protein
MSTRKPALARLHKAAFRQRRKSGMVALNKPWNWISAAEVQKLAQLAYRAATHDLADPHDWPQHVQAYFVQELASAFEVLIAGRAQSLGIVCAPAGAQHYAACLRAGLPDAWRPQYPLYKPAALPPTGIQVLGDHTHAGPTHD